MNNREKLVFVIDKFWSMGENSGWYGVAAGLSLEDLEHIGTLSTESFTYVNYVHRRDTFNKIIDIRRKGDIPTSADLTKAEL